MWDRLRTYFRPPPIASVPALRTFIEERAALIAQKCAIDYCRGKTGLASYALFTEKSFLDALDICRWETFATVLGDLLIVAEVHLRPQATTEQHPALCAALIGMHSAALATLPAPAHRSSGWGDAEDAFARRFRSASQGRPRQVLEVADHSAKRLFETLPIHASYRELDKEVVYGAVRFRMIAVSAEMQRRFAAPELVKQLLA
jgi:hypothetical protein